MSEILRGRTVVSASDLADYVANLPPGSALWQHQGGWLSFSTEAQLLTFVLHGLEVLAWQNTGIMQAKPRGPQPKPMPAPEGVDAARETAERLESKRENRAARQAERKKLRATE